MSNNSSTISGTRGALFASGGRFAEAQNDPIMEKFNESIHFDQRMWREDIRGSQVYAKGICLAGILTEEERESILSGLNQVYKEWEDGSFELRAGDEDIHTANERRLTEITGEVGKKLHTGRSRNDQVATDTRMYTVSQIHLVRAELIILLKVGCEVAQEHIDVLSAGYTHLQPAQPIRFSHWLMSHLWPIVRDVTRLMNVLDLTNKCPLGSGALAGNAFGVDREFLCQELGFDSMTENSLDAVCDRDFVVDFLMWHTLLLTHFSQLSEDLIIMNLQKCVEISDMYATGSSLMPQKKNPDALELLRGKAGIALGRQVGFIAVLKGLPRAYNKDLQEDKVPLFAAIDTVKDCISIATGVIATITPKKDALLQTLCPEMLATDLADYLVRKGVPFRETHHISGAAVRKSEELSVPLDKLTLDQLQAIDIRFEEDVMQVWNYEMSVERKSSIGGTSKAMVQKQIDDCLEFCNK